MGLINEPVTESSTNERTRSDESRSHGRSHERLPSQHKTKSVAVSQVCQSIISILLFICLIRILCGKSYLNLKCRQVSIVISTFVSGLTSREKRGT